MYSVIYYWTRGNTSRSIAKYASLKEARRAGESVQRATLGNTRNRIKRFEIVVS